MYEYINKEFYKNYKFLFLWRTLTNKIVLLVFKNITQAYVPS